MSEEDPATNAKTPLLDKEKEPQETVNNAVQPPPAYEAPPQQPAYTYQSGQVVIASPQRNTLPRNLQPSDYLVMSVIVAIVCAIFNVTSLFFSVPALICSVLAYERRNYGEYKTAKTLGTAAVILNMLAVTWVVVGGVVAVGVLVMYWTNYLWYD